MPKPVAPSPALRSDPANFSANAEAQLLYIPEAVDFVDEQAEIAQAAALAGDLPDLTGRALLLLQVNAAEDGLQFYTIPDGGSAAAIATTSGSTASETIPAAVQEITVLLNGVSVSNTSEVFIRVGSGATPEETGYASNLADINASATSLSAATNGFSLGPWGAGDVVYGSLTLSRFFAGSNTWVVTQHNLTGTEYHAVAGAITLSGELDVVQLFTSGATYDAGSISVRWR